MPSLKHLSQHTLRDATEHPLSSVSSFVPQTFTPNSHIPLPNTYTSACSKQLAEGKSLIYQSLCTICLHEPQKKCIYCIYSNPPLPLYLFWLRPAVEGLQGVKVHAGSYSHSSAVLRAVTGSANRRHRG